MDKIESSNLFMELIAFVIMLSFMLVINSLLV